MSKSYRRTLIVFIIHTFSLLFWTRFQVMYYINMQSSESQMDMWGDVWMSIVTSFVLFVVAWVAALVFFILKKYLTSVRISVFAIAFMMLPFLFVLVSNLFGE